MANIDKLNFGNDYYYTRPFGTCTTAMLVSTKVVEGVDYWVPYEGATILVYFTYAGPTDSVLSVNGTEAAILNGASIMSSSEVWKAGSVVEFMYINDSFRIIGINKNSGSSYTLPLAASGTRGGIQIGYSESGTNYAVKLSSEKAYVTVPWTDEKTGYASNSTNSDYPILFKPSTSSTTTAAKSAFNVYVTLNPSTRVLQVGHASTSSYYGKVQAGNGFFQTSDERLKDFGEDIKIDFDVLKSIPKKYFTWKDDEEKNSNIGTSAQAIQKIYPELVSESNDGTLVVDYNKLSVIALKAVDELHAENQELKDRLTKLEEMVYGNRD